MAENGVAHLVLELFEVVRFGENRLSKSAGRIATLRRLFNDEDQLVHGWCSSGTLSVWLGSLAVETASPDGRVTRPSAPCLAAAATRGGDGWPSIARAACAAGWSAPG